VSSAFVVTFVVGVALVGCGSQPGASARAPSKTGPLPGPGYPAPAIFGAPAPEPPRELKAFEVVDLLGPYPRLEDICARPSDVHWDHERCGADVLASTTGFEGARALEAPKDPFLEVRLVAKNAYGETQAVGDGFTWYHLGIRAREGWFFLPEFTLTQQPDFGSHYEGLVVAPMRLFRVSDTTPPLLEVVYWEKLSDDDRATDDNHGRSAKSVVLFAVASDGRPRCTAPTLVAEEQSLRRISTGAVVEQSKWELDVRYGPGQVELVLLPGAQKAEVPASLLGSHPLAFERTR